MTINSKSGNNEVSIVSGLGGNLAGVIGIWRLLKNRGKVVKYGKSDNASNLDVFAEIMSGRGRGRGRGSGLSFNTEVNIFHKELPKGILMGL